MVKVATDAPKNSLDNYSPYQGKDVWWTADPKGEAVLQESAKGYANYKQGIPLMTYPSLFALAVKKHPKAPALRSEMMGPLGKGEKPPGPVPLEEWKTWTWKDYFNESKAAAKAFIALGLEQHDTVNIFGFNSPEWLIAMSGAILAGGKAAGIYPSDNAEAVRYKSDHSNGVVAVVENEECLNKFKMVADDLPVLKAIVCWACDAGEDFKTSDGRLIKTMSFEELVKMGQSLGDESFEKRNALIKPSHACALIYTSGTTGAPKAVMISHDNFVFTAATVPKIAGVIGNKNKEERIISYLPLSHVAGMMVDVIVPTVITANIAGYKGYVSSNFARPYDLKLGTLVARLQTVQPTIFLGVPRVWEKMMERLKIAGAETKGFQKKMAMFAKARAAKYTTSRQLGMEAVTPKAMMIARVVLKKIKTKLGLNKCKFYFSGAAPMTVDCLEFFGALGINVNEVYGMSECTGACTWSTDDYHVWGSVGFEIPGVEIRVFKDDGGEATATEDLKKPSEDEQGELCYRGRSIMMGYMANPRLGEEHVKEIEEKNRAAIDSNGFLHSGDKGTRDVHGMIKITGRYKELIIGAGGENIAPVPIEDEIKRLCPIISNVMMIGNKRKFNVAVVTLKAVGATGELPGGNKLAPPASTFSTNSKTITEAMKDEVFINEITRVIKAVNKNEAVVPSNAAKIQKFTILPRDFSVLTNELTATLKLKRSVVEDEFLPIIDKMFQVSSDYVDYNLAPTQGLTMGEDVAEVEVIEAANLETTENMSKQMSLDMSKEFKDAEVAVDAGETGEEEGDNDEEDKE